MSVSSKYMQQIYNILLKNYGKQGWWPISGSYFPNKLDDKSKLEIILGAILTQNTSWKNVEKALTNLRKHNLIDIDNLLKTKKLAELIKSAGYFNQKAERLKIIANFLKNNPIKELQKIETNELREILLEIKGIGPETADSILLYAFEKPIFVIDAYTKRIFSRLGFCKKETTYEDLQTLFHKNVDKNTYNEYHALIVEHAKRFCKTKPECEGCILRKVCRR